MRITYVGQYRAVEVPALGLTAEHGKPIEVPDDAARHLLRQPRNWAEAKPEKTKSKTETSEGSDQ
ncbi:hypothetical protein SAMN04487905_10623 [Actinopolyspora xinjiangensis]|uniref:Uncharacterized protein n=1 Tax=Actinopolyspora xinjiangensis TaxID=405564 RepID=A0A1H0U3F0_9ACTN|nr:hypothetical protein [Actinopolyspora xinjiangensis]SDP60723.1 hypothetical protein SAMN04487905_10623 [Actinopolyspora xinjiangensis]